jgi:hypothetical protein
MHPGSSQSFGRHVSETTARHETVTLAAYYEALCEFGAFRWSQRLLVEHLGDIDRQAEHPVPGERLALAEPQVRGIVRAWLANNETERDDAAPTLAPRVAPEDERVDGLTRKLIDAESQGGFSRAAWGIAGTVLQHLIRPTVEVSRALGLRQGLDAMVDVALASTYDSSSPRPLGGDPPTGLLTSTVLRLRADGRIVTDAPSRRERRDAWLRMAGDAARAHACWSQIPVAASMRRAAARATDRLAASLVPDAPDRFDHERAVEHAVQAAFDAAVTALGLATPPDDPIFVRSEHDVLETLLEASSSGLIGAWAVDRATG